MPDPRVLLFAPHPDDESIGAGGLLQHFAARGAVVKIVYITDGENNHWAHRALLKRWRLGRSDRCAYADLRRREALDALAILGIDPAVAEFLHLPDGGVAVTESLVERFRCVVAEFDPTIIIGPSPDDLHSDHVAVARLIAAARGPRGVFSYIVHGRRTANPVAAIHLSAAERLRKERAIAAHRSQMILGADRFLRHASEYESFFDPIATRSLPAALRTVTFWCSTLMSLAPRGGETVAEGRVRGTLTPALVPSAASSSAESKPRRS